MNNSLTSFLQFWQVSFAHQWSAVYNNTHQLNTKWPLQRSMGLQKQGKIGLGTNSIKCLHIHYYNYYYISYAAHFLNNYYRQSIGRSPEEYIRMVIMPWALFINSKKQWCQNVIQYNLQNLIWFEILISAHSNPFSK